MKAIDDFPFDWIARDLCEGKCIPFLGAGASAFPKDINAKPPTARTLALELARESRCPPYQVVRGAASSNDPAAQERSVRARMDRENLTLVSSSVRARHRRSPAPVQFPCKHNEGEREELLATL